MSTNSINTISVTHTNLDASEEVAAYDKFERDFAEDRSAFFNCLTKEQQLLAFCEVVHRLVQSEIYSISSYRGVLYGAFGFESDAYAKAQVSGFLELHNSIEREPQDCADVGAKILKLYGITATKEEVANRIKEKHSEFQALQAESEANNKE